MAAASGSNIDDVAAFATRTIATANNLDDVITTVPSNFRFFVAPLLRSMQDVHAKLCNAQRALASLEDHKASGTWPPYIAAMHNPFQSIQPAKEARSLLLPALAENNIWFKGQQEQALLKVIELKQAEIEILAKNCSPPTVESQIATALASDRVRLEKALGDHVLPPDAKGKSVKTGVNMAQFMVDDYRLAEELTPVWVAKSWDFTRIKSQRSEAAIAKKKDLVAAASDPMDLDPPNLEKLVKDAVASALRTKPGPKTNTRNRAPVSFLTDPSTNVTNSSLGKRKFADEQEEARFQPRQKRSPHQDNQTWELFRPQQEQATASSVGQEFGTSEQEEDEQIEYILSRKWNHLRPSSLPKELLDLPTEKALSIIQSRLPISQISRADLNVKLGPGVSSIPENIDNILMLGHRFLFPSVFSVELPMISYMSLARRIKWQAHFFYNKKQTSFLDLYPQFRLPQTGNTAVPETTPLWVVTMLEKGRLEMLSQIKAIPSRAASATVDPKYKRQLAQLRDWRKTNQFLVLPSDKNLGTTVVSSEWYSEKLEGLIRNTKDFIPISEEIYLDMIKKVQNEISNFECRALPYEVREYILADCTLQHAEKSLPKFHGLPKVHKEPWALRPIVPCHSYPLTNASKVLSELLKPLVRSSKWILESTQDLARLLETIRLPSADKYWLATGDVTAMYPNIPRERAHEIIAEIADAENEDLSTIALLKKLAEWSDNYLAFSHQNKVFYQKDGLAMGIPAAPDVANLYMSYFENSFAGRFPLYKRYIDDVIVLVKAPTRKDALEQLSVIQADGLTLTWSLDEKTINFLDLCITQEAGYLSFKPYRKPMNSYERLPFTSYHPLHVKRAAFCGEVSRIARLCSKYPTYYDQISYVRDIYLKRGYPGTLLHNWIRAEARNRWDSRYKDSPEGTGASALWLKSEYNNVWQHIDLHKVWSAMNQGRPVNTVGSPFENIEDVKLSLKRFRNLGEINNRYNADILKGLRVEENETLLQQAVEPIQPVPLQTPQPLIVKYGKYSQTVLNFPKV
jgi:hypothetical protein